MVNNSNDPDEILKAYHQQLITTADFDLYNQISNAKNILKKGVDSGSISTSVYESAMHQVPTCRFERTLEGGRARYKLIVVGELPKVEPAPIEKADPVVEVSTPVHAKGKSSSKIIGEAIFDSVNKDFGPGSKIMKGVNDLLKKADEMKKLNSEIKAGRANKK